MRRILFVWLGCLLVGFSFAQDQKGHITVAVAADKSPLENATVELLRSKDSVLVKAAFVR